MCNPNYRITIEPISDEARENFPEELRGGIECEGYALIADKGSKTEVNIQSMSNGDIAIGIANTPCLLASAHIAKAMQEAREIEMKSKTLSGLFAKLSH